MKASGFAYFRARSVSDAVAAFRNCEGDARYLAGGQSLLASMNLRLLAPDLLIDIANIEGLRGIHRRGNEVRVGALTRHAEILSSPIIVASVPLLAAAAPWVAHPAIRNKGTMGGSIALADPASEFPAVTCALNARIELDNGERVRFVNANEFFLDLYETAAEPDEILSAIWFPVSTSNARYCFEELARRRGDYAIVGVAISANFRAEIIEDIRIVFFSVGPTPLVALRAEAALKGVDLSDRVIAASQQALADDLSAASDDVHVSAATRLHLARVLLRRQLHKLRLPASAAGAS
jgi:carbon-monoxide dehydrogenase medium subunit